MATPRRLDKYKRHSIEVVVDRFVVRHAEAPEGTPLAPDGRPIDPETGEAMPDPDASRLADSIETALRLGEGLVLIAPAPRDGEPPEFEERRYSERYSCPYDGFMMDELEPRNFSFNSPHGACPSCTGLGTQLDIEPDLVIPDRSKSIQSGGPRAVGEDADGRLVAAQDPRGDLRAHMAGTSGRRSATCPPRRVKYLLYAAKDERVVVRYRHERGENTYNATFEGVVTNLDRRFRETDSDFVRSELEKYMVSKPCPTCGGKRLRPEILAVTIGDRNIWDVSTLSITDALAWVTGLGDDAQRAGPDDRLPGAQGDRRPARVPHRRRARLPHARSDERVAVGR